MIEQVPGRDQGQGFRLLPPDYEIKNFKGCLMSHKPGSGLSRLSVLETSQTLDYCLALERAQAMGSIAFLVS